MSEDSLDDRIDDTQIILCGLLYFAYRQAGSPFGEDYASYKLWVSKLRKEWEDFMNITTEHEECD